MKGDIKFNFNFKINKKIGLFLLAGLSLFAAADFVSMVDVKSSGGIVVEKETQTVGAVVFRMDSTNPADIYGGTWKLLSGDATITFGDGSDLTGALQGTNDPLVPVVAHNHTMNHDHPSVNTNTTGNHAHSFGYEPDGSGGSGSVSTGPHSAIGNWSTSTTGNHNHSVNIPNYSGNTGATGTSSATMDVRGARMAINVWQRIS